MVQITEDFEIPNIRAMIIILQLLQVFRFGDKKSINVSQRKIKFMFKIIERRQV